MPICPADWQFVANDMHQKEAKDKMLSNNNAELLDPDLT